MTSLGVWIQSPARFREENTVFRIESTIAITLLPKYNSAAMSNKVAIVTDSTAYLPEEYLHKFNITVTPLSVIWDGQVYRDGVDIRPGEFYSRLASSKTMPTTSQVTPGVMHETFRSLLAQGYDVLGDLCLLEDLRHVPVCGAGT